ncbi:hypothetical protein ACVC7V_06960 [Hydrogenophaga sp. A37]|nr:hypothetical protein B0E41_15230 [Hydrogenophaga sp. A37]
MFTDLHRLLDALWKRPPAFAPGTSPTELHLARSALLHSVHDCNGAPTQRLHRRITLARTHRELWALRADAYNLIAMGHCQSIATERIHGMAHLFDGWVEPTATQPRAALRRKAGAGR